MAAKPVNETCPISSKAVDATATFTYQGQLIAFCCNVCKGKFEAEPAKYIAKVKGFKAAPEKPVGKVINAKCPISGKDIDPAATSTYKAQVIGFCCTKCKAKFDTEPEKFVVKVKEFKAPQ